MSARRRDPPTNQIPTGTTRANEAGYVRRWGQNRRVLTFAVSGEEHAEYRAKCKRRGISMNRQGHELIRAFIDSDD